MGEPIEEYRQELEVERLANRRFAEELAEAQSLLAQRDEVLAAKDEEIEALKNPEPVVPAGNEHPLGTRVRLIEPVPDFRAKAEANVHETAPDREQRIDELERRLRADWDARLPNEGVVIGYGPAGRPGDELRHVVQREFPVGVFTTDFNNLEVVTDGD